MGKTSLLFLTLIILVSGILPIFAEVVEIQLDKNSYFKGDSINVKGTVEKDTSGLVTIVLRDPGDKFVLLSQTKIQSDNSFEQDIPINEKFQVQGTYNATAFILNMTAAKTQSFEMDNIPLNENKNSDENSNGVLESDYILKEEVKITNILLQPTPKTIESQIVEENIDIRSLERTNENQSQIADFVDKTKNPDYYLDRYYSELVYKSWFDRNYPNLTIEEAVGYNIPPQIEIEYTNTSAGSEIIPKDEDILMESETLDVGNNDELAQMVLAVGGLAVLFGAVYGIKRKIDTNSRHIILNKDLIKRKIISPTISSNPLAIIKTRLAKGEITIDEYEELKQKLENDQI